MTRNAMAGRTACSFLASCAAILALAGLVASEAHAVEIDWVPVKNAGNANDPATGYGGVAYEYKIGKYDVTIGQYTEFLNAVAKADPYGLYNPAQKTDLNIAGISRAGTSGNYTYSVIGSSAKLPVTYVGWGDAARFANWLQNGKPTTGVEGPGTTETGAYTLNGAISEAALKAVTRNPSATVFIPNENEWYKAAYYNPATHSYYAYPNSSNTIPVSTPPGSTPNTGNFQSYFNNSYAVTGSPNYSNTQNYLTPVGAYTASASPYGLFDTGGDVFQWNETLINGEVRGVRGGAWNYSSGYSAATYRLYYTTLESDVVGFRVAAVPEPSTLLLGALGTAVLLLWTRGRK